MKYLLLISIFTMLINCSLQFGNLNCINFVTVSDSNEENVILQQFNQIPVLLTHYNSSIDLIQTINCEFYVMFINSEHSIHKVFEKFINFSKILLISADSVLAENLRSYLMNRPLNILSAEYQYILNSSFDNIIELFDEDKFIDRLIRNSEHVMEIRASFFQCSPNVIYLDDDGTELKFGGFEYKIFNEITKNWIVSYKLRDFSASVTDPWETSLSDIKNNISDIVFCSIWLTEDHGTTYEYSTYIDCQCITFLVPKPYPLNQASYIYLPFCSKVWILFLVMIVVTAFAMKITADIELKIYSCLDHKFTSLYEAFNEIISITVLSTFSKFPHFLPTKILITSWIIHLLILTTGYSTGFTSLLTSPPYSKSIDTVHDFIEQGIIWGEYGPRPRRIEELKATGVDDFIQLANRMLVEKNLAHRLKLLATRKYARAIKIVDSKFIAEADTFPQFADTLQLMKQCINNYYTIFAFKKNSPYTKIFTRQIMRMREAGLIKYWIHDTIIRHTPVYMNKYFVNPIEHAPNIKKLTFVNLTGAFYLLYGGLVAGFFAFVVELFWNSRNV